MKGAQEKFALVKDAVGVIEAGFSFTEGFYLCALQHDACGKCIVYVVFEISRSVLNL